MLERVLNGILAYCGEPGEARHTAVAGSSADWNKSTGRILAYGRLTSALHKLQTYVQTRGGGGIDPFIQAVSSKNSGPRIKVRNNSSEIIYPTIPSDRVTDGCQVRAHSLRAKRS